MTHTQLVEQLHRSEAELAGLSKFVSDMTSAVDKQIKTLQAHADAAVLVAHLVQSFAFNCVTTEDDGDMVELSKSATSVGGFVKAQHGVFDNKLRADLAEMLNKYAAVERRLAMHGEHRRAVRDLAKRADDAQERLAGMQRRSKVDLVKMAEQQQERDACNERCRRAAADALAEYARLRLDFFACAMEEFNHYVRSHERYLHDTADALRPLTDKASAWHQAAIDLKARSTSGGDAAGSLTGSTTSGIAQQQSQGQQHQQQGPGQKQANQQQQTKQQQHEIVTKIPALQRFVADEKGLVKTLEMLLDEFLDSVMKDGSLFAEMGRDDVSLIFSGVRALYHLHREVLERFAATQSLAATFNEAFVVRLVHTYERYCKTFLVSQEALYQCRKKSRAFAHLVQDVEARTGCSSQGQGNSSSSSGSNNSTGGVDELFAAPLKRIAGYVGLFHDADQLHLTAAEYEYCTRVGETLRELDAEAQRALGASTVRQVLRAVQGWPEGGGCGSALAPERRFVARFAAAAPAGQGELLVFSDCAVFARRPALAGLAGLAGRRHLQSVHAFPAAALAVRVDTRASAKLDGDEVCVRAPAVGSGTFGTVYRGTYRGQDVAVKVLKNQDEWARSAECMEAFQREVRVLERLHHPCVVRLVGGIHRPGDLAIVTEFCPLGSLSDLLKRQHAALAPGCALRLKCVLDAADGMAYLHSHHIVHRDLKPKNLLVVSLDPAAPVVCKISDFGSVKVLADNGPQNLSSGVGSVRWMAPEVILHAPYGMPADVYSFAIVLFETVCAVRPYIDPVTHTLWDPQDIAAFVADGHVCHFFFLPSFFSCWFHVSHVVFLLEQRLEIPKDRCSGKVRTIIEQCWEQEPSDRPTFDLLVPLLRSLHRCQCAREGIVLPTTTTSSKTVGNG